MAIKSSLTRTVSITSGKGGVGKTTITSNLAHQLVARGNKVLILDGDLGMANVEIFFGVKPRGHLIEVLKDEKTMSDIITPVAHNIDLISGGSGVSDFNRFTAFERRALVDAVSLFEYQYDYLLVDTSPGISDNVLYLNAAAQETAVIITPDAASLTDSYALVKVLHQQFREQKFNIICNMVKDEAEGLSLYQRFTDVTHRFLNLSLDYWGSLPNENLFRKSAAAQRLVLRHEPSEEVRQFFDQFSSRIETRLAPNTGKAGLQFFWEQVVGVA